MKALFLSVAAMIVLISPFAQAENVDLKGDAAEAFIAKHFPNADIPGPVKGTFSYINKKGEKKRGYAECFYPGMGAHSNGEVTTCSIIY